MKKEIKKYQTLGTVPKSYSNIKERAKINTSNSHIHDRSFSWIGTDTSVNSDGVILV